MPLGAGPPEAPSAGRAAPPAPPEPRAASSGRPRPLRRRPSPPARPPGAARDPAAEPREGTGSWGSRGDPAGGSQPPWVPGRWRCWKFGAREHPNLCSSSLAPCVCIGGNDNALTSTLYEQIPWKGCGKTPRQPAGLCPHASSLGGGDCASPQEPASGAKVDGDCAGCSVLAGEVASG